MDYWVAESHVKTPQGPFKKCIVEDVESLPKASQCCRVNGFMLKPVVLTAFCWLEDVHRWRVDSIIRIILYIVYIVYDCANGWVLQLAIWVQCSHPCWVPVADFVHLYGTSVRYCLMHIHLYGSTVWYGPSSCSELTLRRGLQNRQHCLWKGFPNFILAPYLEVVIHEMSCNKILIRICLSSSTDVKAKTRAPGLGMQVCDSLIHAYAGAQILRSL
eukprot:jgi/Botrbrau1/8154/Bobra.357_2s0002.1